MRESAANPERRQPCGLAGLPFVEVVMAVIEAMKTTGTCRYFRPDPVPDEVLLAAFDAARFSPQGGNRQPVRWVVVRDPDAKRQLHEWYLQPWKAYLAGIGAGDI